MTTPATSADTGPILEVEASDVTPPATPAPSVPAVTTDSLLLVGPGYSLEIPEAAENRKAALIKTSSGITAITTVAEFDEASAEIKALAKFRNEIEKARTLVKAPVLKLGQSIDDTAKEFGAALKAHEDRLSGLVKSYALKVEEDRRAEALRLQEIERQRVAAEQKAERERLEAQRLKEEAERKAEEARAEVERQRIAAEAKAKADREAEELAAQSSSEGASVPAEEEEEEEDIEAQIAAAAAIDAANAAEKERLAAAARESEAEALREAERQRLADESRRASIGAAQVAKGVKFPLAFEVEDLVALYEFDPSLVTLSPKAREITAKLKQLEDAGNGEIPTVPGLRIFRDAKIQKR